MQNGSAVGVRLVALFPTKSLTLEHCVLRPASCVLWISHLTSLPIPGQTFMAPCKKDIYTYIHIYTQRERERERECMCHVCKRGREGDRSNRPSSKLIPSSHQADPPYLRRRRGGGGGGGRSCLHVRSAVMKGENRWIINHARLFLKCEIRRGEAGFTSHHQADRSSLSTSTSTTKRRRR